MSTTDPELTSTLCAEAGPMAAEAIATPMAKRHRFIPGAKRVARRRAPSFDGIRRLTTASIRFQPMGVVTQNSLFACGSASVTCQGMIWRSIRLELASTGEFPGGSVSRTFLVNLPLDDHDAVDRAALARNPRRATVRRHWSTEPDE